MTVKTTPYSGPAWGEPGHEPWQKIPYPTSPRGRWGWWNDPGVTDEDIWKSSPEYRYLHDFKSRINQIPDYPLNQMAGMFMGTGFGLEGPIQKPWWMESKAKEIDPRDYLM